jgi:D-threo-aldose 1-dehydrogenase
MPPPLPPPPPRPPPGPDASRAPASGRPLLPQRSLGRGGLVVTALGFGGAPLGDLYARLDDATAIATVDAAYDTGVRLFDTSPLYGRGLSEHRTGTALRRRPRDSFVLSTKLGRVYVPVPDGVRNAEGYVGGLPFEGRFDYSYDGALRSLEQSLLRLGTARIDIVLIHDIDAWTHGADAVEARYREALDGAWRALAELRAQGVVRAIGVGVNDAAVCARVARDADPDCVLLAGRYSLLEQPALDDFLPLAQARGIGVLLGGVFNSGILATGAIAGARYNYRAAPPEILARVARIGRVCAAHEVDLPHAAIAFALGHPAVASIVLGAVTPDEATRNAALFARPVPAALWRDLVVEGLLRGDAPLPA